MAGALGQKIRLARRERFDNAETFAVELGISLSTVQRWETGKTEPSLSKLRVIAAATGKPLAFFLEREAA